MILWGKMTFPDASQNLPVSLANDGLQRRVSDEQSRAHRQGSLEDLRQVEARRERRIGTTTTETAHRIQVGEEILWFESE